MTTDRDALLALVAAIERVDRHSPNARYSGTVIPAALYRARLHLDREPARDCSEEVARASSAAYAAGQARNAGAQP